MHATISANGQLTLPQSVRDTLHVHPGDRIELVFDDDGRLFMLPLTRPLATLKGMLPKPARPIGLTEMNAAVAALDRS